MSVKAPARIHLLPEHLIDQIKAGEVVERPANVLKELIENALDAGATKIDVEIRDNGLTLLRVTDDGSGINPSDLEMAFGRHATSKIERFDDLYRLRTFGFRGEALPSVASVSRLECVSWVADNAEGASLRFEGGLSQGVFSAAKAGIAHGTVMTVKDLFFNTPVRLKFMQSASAEKNWLKKFFYAFVLAYPQVSFTLQWDDAEKLLYPAAKTHVDRVRQFYSAKVGGGLKVTEAYRQWHDLSCRLLLIEGNGHRPDGPLEQVLINRRVILDKGMQRMSQQILEKHWTQSEQPTVLILMDLPGDQVDVNVHPNKTVVKFHQHNEVVSLVTATLRECLPQAAPAQAPLLTDSPQLVETPRFDLPRGREESYTYHMEQLSDVVSAPAATIGHWPGPFFIHESHGKAFYVDGKAVLLAWAKTELTRESDPMPLLVSQPLRNLVLPAEAHAVLQTAGFEIDELEKNFWVVRAIPSWLKGLPLETGLAVVLKTLQLPSITINDFSYASLSPGKWSEIWEQVTLPELLEGRAVIELSPALFHRMRP